MEIHVYPHTTKLSRATNINALCNDTLREVTTRTSVWLVHCVLKVAKFSNKYGHKWLLERCVCALSAVSISSDRSHDPSSIAQSSLVWSGH